jgi:hypothetical protein
LEDNIYFENFEKMGKFPMKELEVLFTRDLPIVLMYLAENVLYPAVVLMLALAGAIKVLLVSHRHLFPPPYHFRHTEAVQMYRQGNVEGALKDFSKLDKYGRSYLSMACHEIYVVGTAQSVIKGVAFLKEAQERNIKISKKELITLKTMKADAAAILGGNSIMVRTNANLAKEEFLGIVGFS